MTHNDYLNYARPIAENYIKTLAMELHTLLPKMVNADYKCLVVTLTDFIHGCCDIRVRDLSGGKENFVVHYQNNKRYYTTGNAYNKSNIENDFVTLCNLIQTEHFVYKENGFRRLTMTFCPDCVLVRNGYSGSPDPNYPIDIYQTI